MTPHTLDLPAGQHEISISKDGVNSEKSTVDVQGGKSISKKLEIAEAAQAPPIPKTDTPTTATTTAATATPAANPPDVGGSGKIAIFTTPPGLEVTIDGKVVGSSPQYATLPQGDHTFSVKCPNSDPHVHNFKIKTGSALPTTVKCSAE